MRTTHLRLPFTFDVELLRQDLSTALSTEWTPHFNTHGYTGGWKSVALLAPGGNAQHILAMSADAATLEETAVLSACPYFREVLSRFRCPFESVRLLNLQPGAEILPHQDYQLGYEDGTFRLHIPIVTNDGVEFILNGETLNMQPGECWYTNVNYEHSVANRGSEDRVHLVIDGTRNEWSDELFFSLAPPESFDPPAPEALSRETKLRMLEELELSDQPAARELAQTLRGELGLPEK